MPHEDIIWFDVAWHTNHIEHALGLFVVPFIINQQTSLIQLAKLLMQI